MIIPNVIELKHKYKHRLILDESISFDVMYTEQDTNLWSSITFP